MNEPGRKPAGRTAAEAQMEELRRLRASLARRKPEPAPPKPTPVAPPDPGRADPLPSGPAPKAANGAGFELSEAALPAGGPRARRKGPSLPLSLGSWRLLVERQRKTREFRRWKDMGDWAAEIILALPPGAHALSAEAKAEALAQLKGWLAARGLK